jgi:hypothetical protein
VAVSGFGIIIRQGEDLLPALVSGCFSAHPSLLVTSNGILKSLNKPDHFALAIVEFAADDIHRLHYIRRTCQRQPDFGAACVNYDIDE